MVITQAAKGHAQREGYISHHALSGGLAADKGKVDADFIAHLPATEVP